MSLFNTAQDLCEKLDASAVVTWTVVRGELLICSYGVDVDSTNLATEVAKALTRVTQEMLRAAGNPFDPDVKDSRFEVEDD